MRTLSAVNGTKINSMEQLVTEVYGKPIYDDQVPHESRRVVQAKRKVRH